MEFHWTERGLFNHTFYYCENIYLSMITLSHINNLSLATSETYHKIWTQMDVNFEFKSLERKIVVGDSDLWHFYDSLLKGGK